MPGIGRDRVHRFVAAAWCENDDPEHKTVIDHIDGVKTNNFAINLEWVTYQVNSKRASDMGLNKSTDLNFSYIVETDVENRQSVVYTSRQEIAEKYGTNVANISAVLSGRYKSSQGKLFTYLNMTRQDLLTMLGYVKPEEEFSENVVRILPQKTKNENEEENK